MTLSKMTFIPVLSFWGFCLGNVSGGTTNIFHILGAPTAVKPEAEQDPKTLLELALPESSR